MLKLDRKAPFGTISPPYHAEGCDRPAHYDQGGRLYDNHDRLIEPGKPARSEVTVDAPAPVAAPAPRVRKNAVDPLIKKRQEAAVALIKQEKSIPWLKFRNEARHILGAEVVTNALKKEEVVALVRKAAGGKMPPDVAPGAAPAPEPVPETQVDLEEAIGAEDDPDDEDDDDDDAGDDDDRDAGADSGDSPEPPPAAPPPVEAKSKVGVDLAAWGRGEKNYLFGEIQKEIRGQHSKQVMTRRDAVDFLIEKRIITAKAARTDVG
jgi:hypothetical protein